MNISMEHSKIHVGAVTRAATRSIASGSAKHSSVIASRFLTGKLTFRFRTQSRRSALPGTLSGLTERRAVGLRRSTSCSTHSGAANGLALRASAVTVVVSLHLTHFFGTANTAHRIFAMHLALSALARFAIHLTIGTRTHRVALGRTNGVIAEPLALGMA